MTRRVLKAGAGIETGDVGGLSGSPPSGSGMVEESPASAIQARHQPQGILIST
jgi:hypothetical protein